ncbi:hypothetical protein GCM10027190_51030 [Spirosoma areae]
MKVGVEGVETLKAAPTFSKRGYGEEKVQTTNCCIGQQAAKAVVGMKILWATSPCGFDSRSWYSVNA